MNFAKNLSLIRNYIRNLTFSVHNILLNEGHIWSVKKETMQKKNSFLGIKRFLYFIDNENTESNKDDKRLKSRLLA